MTSMGLAVAGAAGRMGRTLVRAISETDGVHLCGALERADSEAVGMDAGELAGLGRCGVAISADIRAVVGAADGLVDFTRPRATLDFAALAAASGTVHVIGTTGLEEADEAAIETAGRRTVIVKSGNMSLGVNLLAELVRQASRALDADFDIEIVEMHHRHKVDAPSGTAYLLGEAAAAGRNVDLSGTAVKVRDGQTGPRQRGSIGFATLRGGSVVGEHTVILAGEGERIELSHKAGDRSIFARGAIRAALWARGREPGVYSMTDVLGLGNGPANS